MLGAAMRSIFPPLFLRNLAGLILATTLLGCAGSLALTGDSDSAARHGITGVTPLPLPSDMDHLAVTISGFTLEGYDATILAVHTGIGVNEGLFVVENVPLTDNRTDKPLPAMNRFVIPIRDSTGGVSNVVGQAPNRQSVALFRGRFDPLRAEPEPLLVFAARLDDYRAKSWRVGFTVYHLAQSRHATPGGYYRVSVFEPVKSWQTAGQYCDEGTALRTAFGMKRARNESADGCYQPEPG